nr:hypothetical protein [uncultured Allomuricauda sp.]
MGAIIKVKMSISKFVIGLIVLFFHNTSIFAQIERGSRTFVFEPKNISTDSVEFCAVFSRQEREVYFARSNQKWGKGDMKSSIYYAVKKNGIWSTPETASFSGLYDDSDPHLTRDGNTLYFISKRPSEGIPTSADIWMVEKDDTGNGVSQ